MDGFELGACQQNLGLATCHPLGKRTGRNRRPRREPSRMAGSFRAMNEPAGKPAAAPLTRLSIVVPARDEEGCIASMVEHLHVELKLHNVPHEIVVVDDGSSDRTWQILQEARKTIPELAPVQNTGLHGFGRAVICGLDHMKGDAVVIMMADESDDCRDAVRYWQKLNEGFDCVFGSRFMKGGGVIDYPRVKLFLNRMANLFIRLLFGVSLNDTTNAFKAYRRTVIEGSKPLLSAHFNLTVEIPLKTMVRGYSWTVMPITWRNRRTGVAKLKIQEMGSRYLFICLYLWLETHLTRGDYKKESVAEPLALPANRETHESA